VIRRLLPAASAILIGLAFLRWQGERQGLYGTTVGLLLMTAVSIGLGGWLLWYFGRWLDRDETARRDMEGQLRRSSRHFELSRDLVCTAGFDGYFKQLNAEWTQTLGWSEEELRSRPFIDFVHPDDREITEKSRARLSQVGGTGDLVNRYATKDGGWRWIDWKSMAIVEEGLIYASARDVTHRKAAEAALEASLRQTRQILETAHDAFISIDAGGLITDWNPQAQASFGWSRQEALGRELAATVVPEGHRDAHRQGLDRFLATGERQVLGKRLELMALHRNGREFPIELTISPLKTEQGYTFNAFLRDITEPKLAQAELALARDQALEASRMKSMFVANVSHEIRTPMNGVIGMAELLLDDEQREYAETISASGETLLKIIDDILDFSKIEAGKLELDPIDFDLRDAIEKACGMLAARAHEKGLELAVAIEPGVPALVHGDGDRLRQVITNLVSNAIKFTAGGEVVVRVSAGPADEEPAGVRLEVSDTGIGIEPDALQQLFTPFSQADSSTTRKYGGTGLGLAISSQLIGLMGGTIGAHSEPGKGSCFWLELALPRAAASHGPPPEGREIAGLRVLVVDDNVTSRRILERQLNGLQLSCEVAADAAEAIELLRAAARGGMPYALGLLDLNMPDVDGYQLAAAIRAHPDLRGMRLVLLSSSGGSSGTPEEAALDRVLTKPVRQSRLYEEIQAVMVGERPAARRARRPAWVDGDGPRPDILVVEDTLVNQAVAAHMLTRCGFAPHLAENGRKALEALSERSYAAVLMDCQMPELDGYETTREIRRREQGGRRIPIIAMTANSMKGERERCLAAGMYDYLSKPLRNQVLKDALNRWVHEPAAGAEHPDATVGANGAPARGAAPQILDEAVVVGLDSLELGMLSRLLALFLDQAGDDVAALSAALARGETVAIARTAHKLKGSSRTLGAAHVAQIASELEASAVAGDLSATDELIDRLRRGLNDTRQAFGSRRAPPDEDRTDRLTAPVEVRPLPMISPKP
jgi:two-component system, sensor histidine kinase and response regulator